MGGKPRNPRSVSTKAVEKSLAMATPHLFEKEMHKRGYPKRAYRQFYWHHLTEDQKSMVDTCLEEMRTTYLAVAYQEDKLECIPISIKTRIVPPPLHRRKAALMNVLRRTIREIEEDSPDEN